MRILTAKVSTMAFQVMLAQALTTEHEETAGLLIGNVSMSLVKLQTAPPVSNVFSVLPLIRTFKRKDRVEISSEQLANASDICESLSKNTGENLRVIGWYHSHPHISFLPSHVDVMTQYNYQAMDADFIGLIVSVFERARQPMVSLLIHFYVLYFS
ncbi:unnamed protein product [Protopolystoma xenopodis]|uniref:MPN domain-containing protein n=1 Tax=Protopolystoma xenopodis TaxID=117903 RepID=A0A448WR76_9PLAT|nr:unnamed protein product [Protopolystoma xenopodis]